MPSERKVVSFPDRRAPLHERLQQYGALSVPHRADVVKDAFLADHVREHVHRIVRSHGEHHGDVHGDALLHLAPGEVSAKREEAFFMLAHDQEAFAHLMAKVTDRTASVAELTELATVIQHMHTITVGLRTKKLQEMQQEDADSADSFLAGLALRDPNLAAIHEHASQGPLAEYGPVLSALEDMHARILGVLPPEIADLHREGAAPILLGSRKLLFTERHVQSLQETPPHAASADTSYEPWQHFTGSPFDPQAANQNKKPPVVAANENIPEVVRTQHPRALPGGRDGPPPTAA